MKKSSAIHSDLLNKLSGMETSLHRLDAGTIALYTGSVELKNELHFVRDWLMELKEELRKTKLDLISNIKLSVINNMQTNFILNVRENSLLSNRLNKMEHSVAMLKYRIYKLLSLAS